MNTLFFASGFAGLIYESIWTQYLKLFLGHAAYAQTLVLAIFMGGMAIGAALAARYTVRIRNPLAVYAAIEATIGVLAIFFHPIFVGVTDGFYATTFTLHLGGVSFDAIKWGLATILILPQSILLGATFPVFAAAAIRPIGTSAGRSLATLYFANSVGGAIGVLVSGFVLIPTFGLPGTIITAGTINLFIAATARWLAAPSAIPQFHIIQDKHAPVNTTEIVLLVVAFLTGASSFIYEIGWIRMLSLVLGSATHSFELMLCSFILGIGLGGLWIRGRIDEAKTPGVLLGYIQIVMGCAAIATISLYNMSFDIVGWSVTNLPKTDNGYALFNVVRYGVALLIMFPAAFCAGMTLPLVTRILYVGGRLGEGAIGRVYSINTVGAITGITFAVHIGLPVLGLEYLVASGAMVDVVLGAALLSIFGGRSNLMRAIAAVTAAMAGAAVTATTFDQQRMSSGVYRTGNTRAEGKVVETAHGRTATISVDIWNDNVTIRTNGKPDAGARIESPNAYTMDEVTMTLLGAVPLMLHDAPRRVANIGFGSGMTGQIVLGDPRVQRLDTIEIEPKIVELAKHFKGLNRHVYEDPRSVIHFDDAKSFFASNGQTYDLIISEPSNPWVSGVSGLFSVEFYTHAARYLSEGGMFAQWLQIYETHPDRVVSVLKAVDRVFDDYLIVALDFGDILILAKRNGKVVMTDDAITRLSPEIRRSLSRINVVNQADMAYRVVGSKKVFHPWLTESTVPTNSDYVPYLDNNADRDRFLVTTWTELPSLALSAFPIAEILGRRQALPTPSGITINDHFGDTPLPLTARLITEFLFGPMPRNADIRPIPNGLPDKLARQGRDMLDACQNPPLEDSVFAVAGLAIRVMPYLSSAEGRRILTAMDRTTCLTKLDSDQKQWRALVRYAADRNPNGFGPAAEELLINGQGTTDVRARYLLGMSVLGYVGAEDRPRARAVWERFSGKVLGNKPTGMALDLIRAHAQAKAP